MEKQITCKNCGTIIPKSKPRNTTYCTRECFKKDIKATPRPCKNCGEFFDIPKNNSKKSFCSNSCSAIYNNKKRITPTKYMNEKIKYKEQALFRFNIGDYPNSFDIALIEQIGMFHPIDNPNGLSRDHMYSVAEGFKNKIDPSWISHPANCQIMLQSDNSRKNFKSSITIDALMQKIEQWDNNSRLL